MLCSTGVNGRTPKGTFKMGAYRVRFSKFARDGRYGQYWTQIRKAIYFHTTLYTAKDVNAYEAASFNKLGVADLSRRTAGADTPITETAGKANSPCGATISRRTCRRSARCCFRTAIFLT